MKRLQGCHGNGLALPLNPMSWLLKSAVDVCVIGSSLHLVNHRSEFSFLLQINLVVLDLWPARGIWNSSLSSLFRHSIDFHLNSFTFSLPLAEDRLSQGHGHRSTARSADGQRLHSTAGHQCRLEQVFYFNLSLLLKNQFFEFFRFFRIFSDFLDFFGFFSGFFWVYEDFMNEKDLFTEIE